MQGPYANQFRNAATEEFRRLLSETQCMAFIYPHQKPSRNSPSYYNPHQGEIKKKLHLG
jgi:uncharacterized protein (DUF1810 family)